MAEEDGGAFRVSGSVRVIKTVLPLKNPAGAERQRRFRASENGKLSHEKGMPNRRLCNARRQAKLRGIEWAIEKADYFEVIKNPCRYCGNMLGKPVTEGAGLDRLDNEIGYVLSNVVSCCNVCNTIKNKNLTEDETVAAVEAILSIRRMGHI